MKHFDTFGTKNDRKSPFLTPKRPILKPENHKKALFLTQKQGFFV
jgi:hypothetical protein